MYEYYLRLATAYNDVRVLIIKCHESYHSITSIIVGTWMLLMWHVILFFLQRVPRCYYVLNLSSSQCAGGGRCITRDDI